MYNAKNYQAQGGNEWVIGGKLTVKEGAEIEGFPYFSPAENQVDSVAEDINALVTDFNSLLQKLRTEGLMKEE